MSKQKLVSPILMWAIVALGVIVIFSAAPNRPLFAYSDAKLAFIMLLIAAPYWLYFWINAVRQNKKAALSSASTPELISSGVYGYMRHPIYGADIVLAIALFFFIPETRVALSVIWMTIVLITWMKLEESVLEGKFGKEYREYKKRVPMFIPRFRKKKIKKK